MILALMALDIHTDLPLQEVVWRAALREVVCRAAPQAAWHVALQAASLNGVHTLKSRTRRLVRRPRMRGFDRSLIASHYRDERVAPGSESKGCEPTRGWVWCEHTHRWGAQPGAIGA